MNNRKIMKKIQILFMTFLISVSVFGQLENTRWRSTVIIDDPVNVILDFKKKTVDCYTVADSTMIETMSYTHNKTAFTLTKISGQSDCDNSVPGKYAFKISQGKMSIKLINDDCSDRSSVINGTEWSAWKEPTAVKVSEATLKQYVGTYEKEPGHPIILTIEKGILYAEGPHNRLPNSPLIPLSNSKFFLRVAGAEIEFIKDAFGNVKKFISHVEKDYEFMKIK